MCISNSPTTLYWKATHWLLPSAFSASTEMLMWLLFLILLIWGITLIDLDVKLLITLHSWDKSHLAVVYNFFICCWLAKDLYVYLHEGYWSLVILWCLCLALVSESSWLIEWTRKCFLFWFLSLWKIGIFSLNIWQKNLLVKLSRTGLFFMGIFLITNLISYYLGLSRFSVSDISFGKFVSS